MHGEKILVLLRRGLEHRYFPAALIIFAVVIMLPALNEGFIQDDLYHRLRLVEPSKLDHRFYDVGIISPGSAGLRAAVQDMHSLVRNDHDLQKLRDFGACPWWAPENFRFSNWRPLDSFTHWLDYRLFPDMPVTMHVHNIIWFAAVVFLVTILYRRLMVPVWVASLAALLYTIDDSNYFPAMWIANRNLLLSLVFSIGALLMHHRWRQRNSVASAIAAVFLLLLSLLATEAGIATFGYLFAYEVFIERGSIARRALSLVPFFVLIVIWRSVYNWMGYGAFESGFVVDPVREPLRYVGAVMERLPVLLFGQWSLLPAEMWDIFSDYAKTRNLLIAAAFLLLVLVVFLPMLRRSRVASFWFVGMLLCVLPICATSPMNRNLLFVAIGAFGLCAQFIGGLLAKESWVPRSVLWRVAAWILCGTLILIHLVMAGAGRITAPKMVSVFFNQMNSTVDIGPQPNLEEWQLVVVNPPSPFHFAIAPLTRYEQGQSIPKAIRMLSPGFNRLEITRVDEKTLQLEIQGGNLLSVDKLQERPRIHWVYLYQHYNSFFRSEGLGFGVGERVELSGMSVEVTAVDSDRQPTEITFRFAVSLDDRSLCWMQWDWQPGGSGSYRPFIIPEVGQSTRIAGPF